MSIITSPFPPLQNPPIEPDFYAPNFFIISAITLGMLTTIVTSTANNFYVGQIVRFIIPNRYKTRQLNERQAIVVSKPTSTELVCDITSSDFTPFASSPYVASITGITQGTPATVTAANSFRIGDLIKFTGVLGMTEINDEVYNVLSANSTSFVINADTSSFSAYSSSGTATFYPSYQLPFVLPVGDINSGAINMDISNQQLYIDGSFINVSP